MAFVYIIVLVCYVLLHDWVTTVVCKLYVCMYGGVFRWQSFKTRITHSLEQTFAKWTESKQVIQTAINIYYSLYEYVCSIHICYCFICCIIILLDIIIFCIFFGIANLFIYYYLLKNIYIALLIVELEDARLLAHAVCSRRIILVHDKVSCKYVNHNPSKDKILQNNMNILVFEPSVAERCISRRRKSIQFLQDIVCYIVVIRRAGNV